MSIDISIKKGNTTVKSDNYANKLNWLVQTVDPGGLSKLNGMETIAASVYLRDVVSILIDTLPENSQWVLDTNSEQFEHEEYIHALIKFIWKCKRNPGCYIRVHE